MSEQKITGTDYKGKVVLAYSGGVDTSVIIPYLNHRGYDVIACLGSLGQPGSSDMDALIQKAYDMGAVSAHAIDMCDEFCDGPCTEAIKANGLYENEYPLLSALSRPVICENLVDIAHQEGAVAVAHGCTGKGNDQVRFELECKALDPRLDVLGPVRTWEFTTRQSEIDYCEEHGIHIDVSKTSPYSIDENCWGRAVECGVLENPWNEPPLDAWVMTAEQEDAPDKRTDIVISFKEGKPVALDGKHMSMFEIILKMNEVAGGNGYGRLDMIEDRLVGLKSRECYEQPAALSLIKAHKALEMLCLPGDLLAEKLKLEHTWAKEVYSGMYYSPLKDALDAFINKTQETVTGDVRLRFYRGCCRVSGVRSDQALYDFGLATYDSGDTFDRTTAKGFMDLYGLPNLVWSRRQHGILDTAMPESTYK